MLRFILFAVLLIAIAGAYYFFQGKSEPKLQIEQNVQNVQNVQEPTMAEPAKEPVKVEKK